MDRIGTTLYHKGYTLTKNHKRGWLVKEGSSLVGYAPTKKEATAIADRLNERNKHGIHNH